MPLPKRVTRWLTQCYILFNSRTGSTTFRPQFATASLNKHEKTPHLSPASLSPSPFPLLSLPPLSKTGLYSLRSWKDGLWGSEAAEGTVHEGRNNWGWEVRRKRGKGRVGNKKICGWWIVITQILFIIVDGLKKLQKSWNNGTSELEERKRQREPPP